jgi:hypothetical protein
MPYADPAKTFVALVAFVILLVLGRFLKTPVSPFLVAFYGALFAIAGEVARRRRGDGQRDRFKLSFGIPLFLYGVWLCPTLLVRSITLLVGLSAYLFFWRLATYVIRCDTMVAGTGTVARTTRVSVSASVIKG